MLLEDYDSTFQKKYSKSIEPEKLRGKKVVLFLGSEAEWV